MFGLGAEELVLILVIVLFLFGGTKLPQLSKSIGESIREIRKAFKDEPDEVEKKTAKKEKS